MRVGSRIRLVLLAALATPAVALSASLTTESSHDGIIDRVRNLIPFLASTPTKLLLPQAVLEAPQGGPTVDPARLGDPARLESELRAALATPLDSTRLTVVGGSARLGNYSLGSTEVHHGHLVVLEGDAEIHGRLEGNLVTLDGNVVIHPGGSVVGDVLAINGRIDDPVGGITGAFSTLEPTRPAAPRRGTAGVALARLLGLIGVLFTLTVIGAALVTFARPNLEIVSDTISHSFGRALMAGVLGQVLLVPTFGMLVVGLVLTVAGALLVPFAALAYLLLALIAVVGGFIAMSHAVGETITRRQLARGKRVSPNAYRYVGAGIGFFGIVWLGWVAIGWVPIAGSVVLLIAVLATWLVATAGFGAVLLSRGGIREEFSGHLLPAAMMTDEYLWATPQLGVPAVKRPEGHGK